MIVGRRVVGDRSPRDACLRAVALLEENPERRRDLIALLIDATDQSLGPLWHDVRLAVHAAVIRRYDPARVWVSDDLWAALPDRTHEQVVEVLKEAADSFDNVSIGASIAKLYGGGLV